MSLKPLEKVGGSNTSLVLAKKKAQLIPAVQGKKQQRKGIRKGEMTQSLQKSSILQPIMPHKTSGESSLNKNSQH